MGLSQEPPSVTTNSSSGRGSDGAAAPPFSRNVADFHCPEDEATCKHGSAIGFVICPTAYCICKLQPSAAIKCQLSISATMEKGVFVKMLLAVE